MKMALYLKIISHDPVGLELHRNPILLSFANEVNSKEAN